MPISAYSHFSLPKSSLTNPNLAKPNFGKVDDRDKQPGALASALLGPGGTSFWMGTYTPIPEPPPQARMQMSLSPSGDVSVYVNYLIWDDKHQRFKRQDVHYVAANGIVATNNFKERGGYVQDVLDGEVLYGGAIVDQLRKRLILPSGLIIDGPTGNIYNQQGVLIKPLGEDRLLKNGQLNPQQGQQLSQLA